MDYNIFLDYCRNGNIDKIKNSTIPQDYITAVDNYAVRWAAYNGYLNIVVWLHEHGANITAQNNYAVRWAAQNGHLNIVVWLHEHGADITVVDNFAVCWDSAVRWAAGKGHLNIVKYLLIHGADINRVNNDDIKKWYKNYTNKLVIVQSIAMTFLYSPKCKDNTIGLMVQKELIYD
jgi:pheromone shutdown protein TraB